MQGWLNIHKLLYVTEHIKKKIIHLCLFCCLAYRVIITIFLNSRRHRCREQSFGLCGRGRGWDDLGEWHWNMYNTIWETNRQSRFDAEYRMLRADALGWPREMICGGWWEGGSGLGTHVHLWWIHVNVWQNQYNIVKVNK